MLERRPHLDHVLELLDESPVVGILGPRQVGKTTLAGRVAARFSGPVTTFDLEDPESLARLADPKLGLQGLRGLVVLDEIQRLPELFTVLRVLADRPGTPARFLVLGSASPAFLRQSAESLAGRILWYTLPGLSLDELGADAADSLWLRGGFPRAFLAASDEASFRWRGGFLQAHVERDLPALGLRLPAETMRRFWTMLAHTHAQLWNGAEMARAFGVAEGTVRHYLDVLCGTLMVRRLRPWHANLDKREVKSPKVYLCDSGLVHRLLGLRSMDALLGHPKVGATWEGFVMDQVVSRLGAAPEECFFWGLHSGAELDLLIVRGDRRLGFEVKRTTAPRLTPSMRAAVEQLGLERLDVIHGGDSAFPLAERVRAVPLSRLTLELSPAEI